MGVIGAGPIAWTTCAFLLRTGWQIDEFRVLDLKRDRAQAFVDRLSEQGNLSAEVEDEIEPLLTCSDLILFATTAASPHVGDASLLAHNPTVLHISLRDVSTEIVLACQNIVDDVEHCLKAGTSVHLTEQKVGHRNFIDGTLANVLTGKISPDRDRPRLFSPFGLGVLDVAVGSAIYEASRNDAEAFVVPNFLPETLDIQS
jgi:N-[(2S)-2-amino-2-carboxyethyl]-L-glutamate dehydrogenase